MSKRKAQADDFDVDNLRLDPAAAAATPTPTRGRGPTPPKRNRDFVMVPGRWRRALCQAESGGPTYRLALHLLHQDWKADGRQLRLANEGVAAELSLSRWQKNTALRELEALDLVTVDRRFKKSPLIKVRRD